MWVEVVLFVYEETNSLLLHTLVDSHSIIAM